MYTYSSFFRMYLLSAMLNIYPYSGPTVTKISHPSIQSSTQILKRKIHKFEVNIQTWCWLLTWGKLVTAARPGILLRRIQKLHWLFQKQWNFVGRFTMIIISNNYYSYDYLDSANILFPYTVINIYVKTVFVEES